VDFNISSNNQLLIPPQKFIPPQKGETIICNGVNYFIGDRIGQGAFGVVYECTDEWSNELVAKVILPQNRTYDQVRKEWLSEFQNLIQLRHPNITFIHQAFEYRDTFYLIIEKCAMPLKYIIGAPNIDGEVWLPYVARDILHGLDYLHNFGYIHKDLHPENIFISKKYDLMVPTKDPVWSFKIGDLGISRLEGDIHFFNTVLAQWMLPPEYLKPSEFGVLGKNIDLYHTGLLLLGLLLNEMPQFTQEEILAGRPREMAEQLNSPYALVIARALRRHVAARTQTAIEMWRDIFQAMPK
jgi:serine/threonine protein kinase